MCYIDQICKFLYADLSGCPGGTQTLSMRHIDRRAYGCQHIFGLVEIVELVGPIDIRIGQDSWIVRFD